MKKILCLLAAVALTWIGGCAKQSPDQAAKSYVRQMVEKHKGFELDTSKLTYKVVEQDKDSAKVAISGPVEVKATMSLVKRGGEWVLGEKEEVAKKAPEHTAAATHEAAPKAGQEAAPMAKHEEGSAGGHQATGHKAE